eukprot:CAMPEP_0115144516 /NCGR_PEP_ID=MMETSP0227-20121206/61552_1 /TAXON_ID=89957 /ORGANISM="Polarella glacialis, Strain CCMP 1383" /LENGTH=53 /DNA_ID=CAMNT_0002553829 /DNA_START=134 /DNA_END=292 /DNA_ORIENTATION=-
MDHRPAVSSPHLPVCWEDTAIEFSDPPDTTTRQTRLRSSHEIELVMLTVGKQQ